MAETVGGNQIAAFTVPVNGQPNDADDVLTNDNATRTAYNTHEGDGGLHFQSSVAASRPGAGTQGRKWLDTDTLRVYYDTGSVWSEIAYAALAVSNTFTQNQTIEVGSTVMLRFRNTVATADAQAWNIRVAADGKLEVRSVEDSSNTSVNLALDIVHATGVLDFKATPTVLGTAVSLVGHVHSGADITSGTVADARLSTNVALLAGAQTFSGQKTFSSQLRISDGLITAPGIAFTNDPDTGLFLNGAGTFRIVVGSAEIVTIPNVAPMRINTIQMAMGTTAGNAQLSQSSAEATPAYTFQGDTDTGIWQVGLNVLGIGAGGAEVARFGPAFGIQDGITAPTAVAGVAFLYVDSADGDLKVRFGNGFTAVLAADS